MPKALRGSSAILMVTCLAGTAAAQSSTDPSLAEALFQEGRKLLDAKRYDEACPKFAESQRLDPGIGTLLNLATCHELEGKTASAWAEFTEALGMAQREARASAQQLARSHLDALTPLLPKIIVEVPHANELEGLEVRLDGHVFGKPAWGIAAPLDPGPHMVAASAPGRAAWSTEVVLAPSEPKTVVVPMLVPEAPPPVAPPIEPLPPASPAPPSPPRAAAAPLETQRMIALIVGGAGAATMGAGIVLGLAAKGKFSDSSPYCDASGGCDDPGLKFRESAVQRGNVATAVFVVGAAATAGGVVLWLTAPKQAPSPAASIGLSYDRVVLRGAW
jgi:hypothetical protein